MSAWHGPCHRGAMREHRDAKRTEAERRNAVTPNKRRREYRLANAKRQKRPKSPEPLAAPEATEAA